MAGSSLDYTKFKLHITVKFIFHSLTCSFYLLERHCTSYDGSLFLFLLLPSTNFVVLVLFFFDFFSGAVGYIIGLCAILRLRE